MHRAQILIDPAQHRELQKLADRQGRSISSVVREMIDAQLHTLHEEQDSLVRRRLAVIDGIRRHKADLIKRRRGHAIEVDITRLIDKNREERDEAVCEPGE